MQALHGRAATTGAWEAIHALSYHTYVTELDTIINETTSLYQRFNKPVWITEISSGSDSTAAANLALMQGFVPWANSQPWIERYFWNQAVSCTADRSLCTTAASPFPNGPCSCALKLRADRWYCSVCYPTPWGSYIVLRTHQSLLSSTHAHSVCCCCKCQVVYLSCGNHKVLNDNKSKAPHVACGSSH